MKVSTVAVVLELVLLVILLPVVNGQSPLDQYFETVRGQLLTSCNSEIVSHTAIILGLIIAMGAIGKDATKALTNPKRSYRFLALISFASIIFLLLYESGRLSYWASISSWLIGLTNTSLEKTGVFITSSNATDYMSQINNYSGTNTMKGIGLAQLFYPFSWSFWFFVGLFLAITVFFYCLISKRWVHNQQN